MRTVAKCVGKLAVGLTIFAAGTITGACVLACGLLAAIFENTPIKTSREEDDNESE